MVILITVFFASCEQKKKEEAPVSHQTQKDTSAQYKTDTTIIEKPADKIYTHRKILRDNFTSLTKNKLSEETNPLIPDSVQNVNTETQKEIDSSAAVESVIVNREEAVKPVIKLLPISEQVINEGEEFRTIYFKEYCHDSVDHTKIKWEVSSNKFLIVENKTDSTFNVRIPSGDFYGTDTLTITAFNDDGIHSTVNTVFTVKPVDLINRFPFKPVKDVLVTGVTDVFALIINPVNWEAQDYFTFGAVLLGGATLFTVDKKIHEEVVEAGSYKENDLFKAGKLYGETLTSQLVSLSVATTGIILNEKKVTRLGLELFESYIITDRLVYLFKYMLGRDRPEANDESMKFNPFDSRKNNKNALPSGHAALSFSLSAVFSSLTDDPYLKSLFYIPAVVTCVSRVYQNYHWTSDVFVGAALGYFVGNFIVNRHNKIFDNRFSFFMDPQGRAGLLYNF
ncbi:MAG: phosphatase PAP2 family protein [Ignavibacteriales bacterium]|nr:MAG: phosphatase PAP2 family protein [Ignavibacteriales bacterium]